MQTIYPSKNKEHFVLDFFPAAGVVCAQSTRHAGNMSLSFGDTKDALSNREQFLKKLNIDCRNLSCANQIHGSKVAYVGEGDRGKGGLSRESAFAGCDGLVTDKTGVALGIFTADCLPVFLYDPVNRAIGLIHAGWRSSKENILGNALCVMRDLFSSRPQNLLAAFGPAIGSCCYEVGSEMVDHFARAVTKKNNRYYLDLVSANKERLLGSGIKEENIFNCGICTACRNEDFFSHRRQAKNSGRMMSVAMLV